MSFAKILLAGMLFTWSAIASAQLVGVALDPKAVLVDGNAQAVPSPPPDSVVFLQFEGSRVSRLGRVQAPTSLFGPPSGVAVSADGTFALASTSTRIDPHDPTQFVPDDRLSVIDLSASPMRVVQTLRLGASPLSVAMAPAGRMALAMHGNDDSISVLSLADGHATVRRRIDFDKDSAPYSAVFAPDGRSVLVAFFGSGQASLFAVRDGDLQLPALRDMTVGINPATVAWCGDGGFAVVGNYGRVTGDSDTVSLIRLDGARSHVVDTVSVGPSPEGIACSPDGRHVAVAVQNMSTAAPDNPFRSSHSLLVILAVDGQHLRRIATTPIGGWSEGVGFLADGRTLFVQSIADRSMRLFRIAGGKLEPAGEPIVFKDGAPVAFGIAGQ